MKFIKYSLLILLIPFVFACSDDDEPVSQTYQNVLGVWTSNQIAFNVTYDNKSFTQYFIDEFGVTETEAQAFFDIFGQQLASEFVGTMEFKADNTYEAKFGTDVETGTWALINSDQFILLTSSDGVTELEIESVSATDLVLGFTDEYTEDLNGDGTEEDVVIIIELSLEKN